MELNHTYVPVCLLATACGGGGGDASIGLTLPLTGILVDSPVSGVSYTSPSRTGITQANGEFFYREGDVVAFSLGATELGSATGRSQISRVELAGLDTLTVGNAEIGAVINDETSAFQTTVNLAVLLQTFDADGDPENGIEVTAEIAGLF
ncbi:MAG TPA: hypothetical protein DCM54_12030 [Gammaproteobacteria bacterium]|nr:hypothetical protein [Gammaproteobacteria bacterium]|tara:strand:+ start:34 stop:483 length:450 start_codon:yes stop_codon:yes gene_type:complete